MKKIFLDIETLPAAEEDFERLRGVWQRKKKKAKAKGREGESFEDFLEKTNFSGTFGRIFCIAYALDEEAPVCLSGNEKDMLKQFWIVASDVDLFIGHNILDFDLRFIIQRSMIFKLCQAEKFHFGVIKIILFLTLCTNGINGEILIHR